MDRRQAQQRGAGKRAYMGDIRHSHATRNLPQSHKDNRENWIDAIREIQMNGTVKQTKGSRETKEGSQEEVAFGS